VRTIRPEVDPSVKAATASAASTNEYLRPSADPTFPSATRSLKACSVSAFDVATKRAQRLADERSQQHRAELTLDAGRSTGRPHRRR
jgi:hypothetical protein